MDYKEILGKIGDKVSEISTSIFNKFSEISGMETSSLTIKLLTLLLLGGGLVLALKFTEKVVRIILVLIAIVLIISLGYSFIP